jgi:hypothetical protein
LLIFELPEALSSSSQSKLPPAMPVRAAPVSSVASAPAAFQNQQSSFGNLIFFLTPGPWPRHARKRIAPLSLPDAFAQVGGDPFRQGNPLWRTHVTTCILLGRAVKKIFLPIPLLSGRICCFVDPARPGLVISIQLKPSAIHDPQSSILNRLACEPSFSGVIGFSPGSSGVAGAHRRPRTI